VNEGKSLLLDTHAAVWITEDQPLGSMAVEAINAAHQAGQHGADNQVSGIS
jgi:PIN domain nuclease of toxin-antitoxin system